MILFSIYFFFLFTEKHEINYYQQQNITSGEILYKQIISGQVDTCHLYFSSEKSFYVFRRGVKKRITTLRDGEIIDMNDKVQMSKVMSQASQSGGLYINRYYIDEEGEIIYSNWTKDSLIFRQILKHDPLIVTELRLPKIIWNIQPDTKKIGNFNCTKATTLFRGIKYEAWFTTEVPVSAGPWKLRGLPGLILEAHDSAMIYKYEFISIEIPLKNLKELNNFPKIGTKTDISNYRKVWMEKEEEHISSVISKAAARGVAINQLPDRMSEQELNFDDN
jgi:GLPGLI family protein